MGYTYLKLSNKVNAHEIVNADYPAIYITFQNDDETVITFSTIQIANIQAQHTDRDVVKQLEYLSYLLAYYPNKRPTNDESLITLLRNWLSLKTPITEDDVNRNCKRVCDDKCYTPFKEWKELLELL